MKESLERIGRFDPVRARERFVVGFEPSATRHIVVTGQRVGFVVVKARPADLLLDHLYLRPMTQGRGIGSAVLLETTRRHGGSSSKGGQRRRSHIGTTTVRLRFARTTP